jgi:hypothetical protein
MAKNNLEMRAQLEVFAVIFGVIVINSLLFWGLDRFQIANNSGLLSPPMIFSVLSPIFMGLTLIFIVLKNGFLTRISFYLLLTLMLLNIVANLYLLIINPKISDNGIAILTDASLIWIVSLVVFSLWYWIVDRRGPIARELESEDTRYDLLFPQYQAKIPGWEHWKPKFLDYLFFSFFTSTGFSPADTLPLTKRVKLLMLTEATISLIIIGMVVSRAISLIG